MMEESANDAIGSFDIDGIISWEIDNAWGKKA